MTAAGVVEQIIKKHKKSIRFDEVAAKSGFDDQKLRNIIYRLKKQGKISIIVRGVYQALDK
jgi:predicted transcriptional regulator of viral defense system